MKKTFFSSIVTAAMSVLLLTFSGCMSTTEGGEVGANRKQMMLISEAQMEASANKSYAEVLADAKKKGVLLPASDPQSQRVKAIATRLIGKTTVFRSDAKDWKWQVNVIKDETVNAWCMPGGKIVVYTGIIDALKLTDGELAAVMGHEIAHALKEHSREQASKEVLQELGVAVIATAAGLGDAGTAMLQIGTQLGVTLPFSRKCETEADHMGTELMARAGYDPYEAVNIWEKMNALGGGQPPEVLSTHPSNDSRISDLKSIAKKVYPLYESAKQAAK